MLSTKKRIPTFAFVPRSTVFRSRSSTSFCLIFFTTSISWLSATYLRFAGDALASVAPEGTAGVAKDVVEAVCFGDPTGVVDSAVKLISLGIEIEVLDVTLLTNDRSYPIIIRSFPFQPFNYRPPVQDTNKTGCHPILPNLLHVFWTRDFLE